MAGYKKHEIIKVAQENLFMLKRLNERTSFYNVDKWKKDYEVSQYYKRSHCQYPSIDFYKTQKYESLYNKTNLFTEVPKTLNGQRYMSKTQYSKSYFKNKNGFNNTTSNLSKKRKKFEDFSYKDLIILPKNKTGLNDSNKKQFKKISEIDGEKDEEDKKFKTQEINNKENENEKNKFEDENGQKNDENKQKEKENKIDDNNKYENNKNDNNENENNMDNKNMNTNREEVEEKKEEKKDMIQEDEDKKNEEKNDRFEEEEKDKKEEYNFMNENNDNIEHSEEKLENNIEENEQKEINEEKEEKNEDRAKEKKEEIEEKILLLRDILIYPK